MLDGADLSAYYGPKSDLDERITALLEQAADAATDWRAVRDGLTEHRRRVLARFGLRASMLALRERDGKYLRAGLLAHDLLVREVRDWRDDLVHFAPYYHAARVLGLDPAVVFDEAAEAAVPQLADVMHTFGRRRDVTLGAFLWRQIETPDGPTFEMLDWGGASSGAVIGDRSWDDVHRTQVERLSRWIARAREGDR